MKKYVFTLIALFILSAGVVKAQVTIGSTANPHSFSILELVGGGTRGLRLPQMTTIQRDALQLGDLTGDIAAKARGLQIFNTDTKCVETWNGSKWIQACVPPPKEEILFTVKIDDEGGGTYSIPTYGYVGETYHSYDWNVSVDGDAAEHKEGTRTNGSSSFNITLNLSKGEHQIRITPYNNPDDPAPGWGNAFGNYEGASDLKLISIDAPITTKAFAPNEGSTSASLMFYATFYGCTNLTKGARIVDTYKLPDEITDLSSFLHSIHASNTNLETPIDLSGLEEWLDGNTTITNLLNFLYCTHSYNTVLTSPIDLSGLKGWFKENTSIADLSWFFVWTHGNNHNLKDPIDLTPLSGWFSDNHSIANLGYFFHRTHEDNPSLKLKGQKIFPKWIKTLEEGTPPTTPVYEGYMNFNMAFLCEDQKLGDTGEPQFEDGTVLSSLGEIDPAYNKATYTRRDGINPVNDNWK